MEAGSSKKTVVSAEFDVTPPPSTIRQIRLRNLFGQYDYNIPSLDQGLGKLAIFYGENGLGKTNVLKIIFHLLSPASDRGHRTAVGKVKFQSVDVELSNGITVSAVRPDGKLSGAFRAEVNQGGPNGRKLLGAWDWAPEGDAREPHSRFLPSLSPDMYRLLAEQKPTAKERSRVVQAMMFEYLQKGASPLEGEEAFLSALSKNVPPLFYLSADRIFSADKVERDASPYVDAELRSATGIRTEVLLTKGRERALHDAINSASRQLSRLAVRRSRQGSTSMHGIYQGLIRRLASRAATSEVKRSRTIPSLKHDLEMLSAEYEQFAQYGLTPKLAFSSLVGQLDKVRKQERSMASEVLTPYVESLTGQADTLRPAYAVIHGFISTINQFLYDKAATFNLGDGMIVKNSAGEALHPRDLSSGEQQLLLLFCNIVMVYESGGVFIVDEPEISLNIKWQRKLIDALLRLDRDGTLQFVLASHSMEVITTHRESVIALKDTKHV